MWLFASLIFLSAFLLFQVQPLISKFILPWFGGSASVWLVAMVFFQLVLLLGYLYSYLLNHFKFKTQKIVHLVLILVTISTLPIIPNSALKPLDSSWPTLRILFVLLVTVGLPYFALSTTGPLLQAWYVRKYQHKNPYILYALSNVGSLIALVSFPFLFEPFFSNIKQAWIWSIVFVVFGIGVGILVWKQLRGTLAEKAEEVVAHERISLGRTILWIMLPALASAAFLAVTNHICLDVATIPFLWILPFSLYLLSFILTFLDEIFYKKMFFFILLLASLVGSPLLVFNNAIGTLGIGFQLFSYSLILFTICMVCHGELYRLRPAPKLLTCYYLMIAIGGALGGIFVAIVAPLVFKAYWELPIVLFTTNILLGVLQIQKLKGRTTARERRFLISGIICLSVFFAFYFYCIQRKADIGVINNERNFYGVLRVIERETQTAGIYKRYLLHGVTLHGEELVRGDKVMPSFSYYSEKTGLGLLLQKVMMQPNREVGLVGLGTGTSAYYGRTGDNFTFFDINPTVVDFATKYFSYLGNSLANIKTILGDARLSLEKEPDKKYDVLALDAFSSDAIPVHLLTEEAFDLYRDKLKDSGVIAVHISNRYLDLAPVVKAAAEKNGFKCLYVYTKQDDNKTYYGADWILVTKNEAVIKSEELKPFLGEREVRDIRPWTDHFSNLFTILK